MHKPRYDTLSVGVMSAALAVTTAGWKKTWPSKLVRQSRWVKPTRALGRSRWSSLLCWWGCVS